MEDKIILTTLLNLTNLVTTQGDVIIKQTKTIDELNNKINKLNHKIDMFINEKSKNEYEPKCKKLNNNIINKEIIKNMLVDKFNELNFKVTAPSGRSQPFIILNNNIKIKFSLVNKRNNALETSLMKYDLGKYNYLIISYIENDEANFLIIDAKDLEFLKNYDNDHTIISIINYKNYYYEKRSRTILNAKLNDFSLIK